jgi:dynein heavy chain
MRTHCRLSARCPAPATIRLSLKDAGKGHYNLAESSFEAYRFSKLRRLLGLVRFSMEDSLRYLVQGSMAKFVAFMQVRGLCKR